jgi:hypothetical protein
MFSYREKIVMQNGALAKQKSQCMAELLIGYTFGHHYDLIYTLLSDLQDSPISKKYSSNTNKYIGGEFTAYDSVCEKFDSLARPSMSLITDLYPQ